jgi:NAD(P)H dehydrogenase (quinone)
LKSNKSSYVRHRVVISPLPEHDQEQFNMAKIAIVYFSGYGHTRKQAEAVRDGAAGVAGAAVTMMEIAADGVMPANIWDQLAAQDAIIFGSPTYMGGPAWQFKKFADESSKQWYVEAWKNKIAGGFTTSASVNGDKAATLSYFQTFAMQHSQIWVGTGLKPSNTKAHGPDDVNWTAGMAGALAIAPSDASPEEAPRKGDLETARLYGKRLAEIATTMRG